MSLKSKRFARQFGKACGDFNICNNLGVDNFLVPVDCDIPHLMLLHWIHYKITKMPNRFKLTAVHFYDTEKPDAATLTTLKQACEDRSAPLVLKKVASFKCYNTLLVETAIELECNKVALPDSLDFLNATVIRNMALDGCFTGPSVVEDVKLNEVAPVIKITRPFCYCTDEEIEKFGKPLGFENKPTGIRTIEEPYMKTARTAVEMLKGRSTNVEMNLFHSQFAVQPKYLLTGDEDLEC